MPSPSRPLIRPPSSWLIWPDKKTADDAWAKMQDDPAMANMDMPFDGKRMMWGGFETVFDEKQ